MDSGCDAIRDATLVLYLVRALSVVHTNSLPQNLQNSIRGTTVTVLMIGIVRSICSLSENRSMKILQLSGEREKIRCHTVTGTYCVLTLSRSTTRRLLVLVRCTCTVGSLGAREMMGCLLGRVAPPLFPTFSINSRQPTAVINKTQDNKHHVQGSNLSDSSCFGFGLRTFSIQW